MTVHFLGKDARGPSVDVSDKTVQRYRKHLSVLTAFEWDQSLYVLILGGRIQISVVSH